MLRATQCSPAIGQRLLWALLLASGLVLPAQGQEVKSAETNGEKTPPLLVRKPLMTQAGEINASSASDPKEVGRQLRDALGTSVAPHKRLTLIVDGKSGPVTIDAGALPPAHSSHRLEPKGTTSRAANQATSDAQDDSKGALAGAPSQFLQARAKALGLAQRARVTGNTDVGWSYSGEAGPQNWAKLRADYGLCASGKRQSPIAIHPGTTLIGPAAAINFHYTPTGASVVNDGRTIRVVLAPSSSSADNTLEVRGSSFRLTEINFHTPSEIEVDGKRYPMAAHLVHKNAAGQTAILVVLLASGDANNLIDKVWTYLPLDTADHVDMPDRLLNVNELLPADQRYYQFMGSLSTPPCTEGVLWLVIEQPLSLSPAQLRVFTQLFPMNARPLQAVNGRPVRGEP